MSQHISKVDIAAFDKEVKQAYAANPGLRETIRKKTDVVGSTYRFQKMSQGKANKKVPQADVTLMNIDYGTVTCTLEDWVASELSDRFDQLKINFTERKELATISAKAIRRCEDQLIINALEADPGNTVPVDYPDTGTNTGMNTAKFRLTKRYLDFLSVPGTDRHMVMSSEALFDMLGDDDADTFDKNAVKMLVQGELTTWLGFNIRTIGKMTEGGLPITPDPDNFRSCFAYHTDCVGIAIGQALMTEINYIPMKTSWLINSLFSAGSVVIDNTGVVKVLSMEEGPEMVFKNLSPKFAKKRG